MAEDEDGTAAGGPVPAGPFLREYAPLGAFPAASAQKASVLFYRNGGYSVITVAGVRHVDKRALARPYNVCEIAQGTYVSPLQLELPAAGGTSFFKAEVDIEWEVTDPYLAAVQVVSDVAARLTSPVLERLREITLTYPVTDAEQANRVITRECVGGRWSDLGGELGLRVRLYVRLGVNDEAIEYARQRRGAQADADVTRVRQESFRRMLQGGELEQLSFMLAADPEGAKDFLEKIRQEGRQDERERVDRLYTMALRGELHAADVENQVLNLLNQGQRRPLQGPIGAVPARRERRELEPAPEGPFTPDWVSDEPPRRQSHRAESHRAETYRTETYRTESTREVHRAEARLDDDTVREEPSRPRPRPEPHPSDDYDREPQRDRAQRPDPHLSDDHDREPPRDRARRPEPPYPSDDYDGEPRRSRTYRPGSDPADGYDRPARRAAGTHRPESGPGDGFDRDHRPEPYSADDFGRGPSRDRARRPEPYPSDDYDGEPPGSRTYRPGSGPADDYDPADDFDRPSRRAGTHRPELGPGDGFDREPSWDRTHRSGQDPADDFDREPSRDWPHRPAPGPADGFDREPQRDRDHRPETYPADDFGREPALGGVRRSEPYPADEYDREPRRSRTYRSDPGPADDSGPDSRRRTYRPEDAGDHRADDHGRDVPRGRRRSRDDGWSWAEEDE
ncbi:hypothetical protein [Streptomyces sp. NPDC048720]|uniref:hypothetical protein n=1 Tax=Streptomyces sp. NPDC048720 TaxID=3365588 RepID=UPI003711126F